jgi:type I restriction enzyme S subunit
VIDLTQVHRKFRYAIKFLAYKPDAMPAPPLEEQHRIVAYLDGLQTQVDELTATQDAAQAELEALLPSVLDQAFRGEL